jgi:hypothetical protein
MFSSAEVRYFIFRIFFIFRWFNKTISNAFHLNDRILLLAHVPFGINENLLYRFYDIQYEQKLLSIIKKYSSNIIMCLTGHRHQDIFRVYSSFNQTLGILGHPSISPTGYLSQPSIRKYSYNKKSLILTDYEQYILNLIEAERTNKDQWKFSYRFSSWYHQTKEITSKSLFQLVQLIRKDSFYLKRFLLTKHQTGQSKLTNHTIIQTLCSLTLFHFDEFLLCTRLLEKKNIYYKNFLINNSLEIDVISNEQSIEYRLIYKRVAIGLFIVIIIIFSMIYYISCK